MLEVSQCSEIKCPIQFVLDLLDNKWSILVLRELFGGTRRTHELLAALPGISTKTLTQRLRELEAQGLVERHVYAEIPPRVEYSLTLKGRQIQPVMAALHQVGSQWLEQESCVCPLTYLDADRPSPIPQSVGEDRTNTSGQVLDQKP